MENFNKNLQLFLNNIKLISPEIADVIDISYTFDISSNETYIKEFYSNVYPLRNELSTRNEIIFSTDNVILQNIDFNLLWNSVNIDDTVRENIWKYLGTLYLFSYEYINKIDITNTLKDLKKKTKEDRPEDISDDESILINIINNLSDKKTIIKKAELDVKKDTPPIDNSFIAPELFNGVIGNLAQEIAQEIDPSSLNLNDPSKLIKSLLSGDLEGENDTSGLSSLVKKISNKIQSKIDNGSLNQDSMFNEAQRVMNGLTSNGSMGDLNNLMGGAQGIPNLDGLMSGMSDLFGSQNMEDGEMPDLENLFSGLMNKSNLNKAAIKSVQEKSAMKKKLKEKLKKKKELLKQQELLLLNTQEITTEFIEKDLDTLVREIESAGVSNVSTKKRGNERKKKGKKGKKGGGGKNGKNRKTIQQH